MSQLRKHPLWIDDGRTGWERPLNDRPQFITVCYIVTKTGQKYRFAFFNTKNSVLVKHVWPQPYKPIQYSDIAKVIVREELEK